MTKVPCLFPLSTNLVPGNCFKVTTFQIFRSSTSTSTATRQADQRYGNGKVKRRARECNVDGLGITRRQGFWPPFLNRDFFYLSLLPDLQAAAGRGRGVCVQNSIGTPRHLRYLRYLRHLRHLHELASEELYRAGGWRTFLAVIGVFYLREYDNQIRRDRLGSGLLGAGRLLGRKRRQSLVSLFKLQRSWQVAAAATFHNFHAKRDAVMATNAWPLSSG